jgi:stress-induced morphogen
MAMLAEHIVELIETGLPGAQVIITDLAGDGDHYAAKVVWEGFAGLPPVRRHQLVYDALQGKMGTALHALQLTTLTPDQA